MKKLVLATAFVLCGPCASAMAQSTETPAATPPAAKERETPRDAEQPAAPRAGDPNATGDDKVNGMEVPKMKDSKEGGREK